MPRLVTKRRVFWGLLLLATLAAVLLAWYPAPVLARVGRFFVVERSDFQHVDAVVILGGTVPDRALQAADIVKNGWTQMVLLYREVPTAEELQLERMGIHLPRSHQLNRTVLEKSGVPESRIRELEPEVSSTFEEAQVFREYATKHRLRSVAIVTCKFHSRRALLNFEDVCRPSAIEVFVVPSIHCPQDPSRWWEDRDQAKQLYLEGANLLAFYLGRR